MYKLWIKSDTIACIVFNSLDSWKNMVFFSTNVNYFRPVKIVAASVLIFYYTQLPVGRDISYLRTSLAVQTASAISSPLTPSLPTQSGRRCASKHDGNFLTTSFAERGPISYSVAGSYVHFVFWHIYISWYFWHILSYVFWHTNVCAPSFEHLPPALMGKN